MKYWNFKVPIKSWKEQDKNEYLNLKVGSTYFQYFRNKFETNAGDIVFLYNTKKFATKKIPQGIYLICKIINNSYTSNKIKLKVIKDLRDNIKEPRKYGFEEIMRKIDKLYHSGTYYKFNDDENPEKLYQLISKDKNNSILPKKISDNELKELSEGAKKEITINIYERNIQARQSCLDKYGTRCNICDFSFEKKYGRIGKDFIHVHHLIELSSIGKDYKINPEKDLRPVCPNCHAMLHKRKPAYSIDEIKAIIFRNYHKK